MGIGGFHKQQRRKMVKSEATENGEERSWWWIVGKRRRQWKGRAAHGSSGKLSPSLLHSDFTLVFSFAFHLLLRRSQPRIWNQAANPRAAHGRCNRWTNFAAVLVSSLPLFCIPISLSLSASPTNATGGGETRFSLFCVGAIQKNDSVSPLVLRISELNSHREYVNSSLGSHFPNLLN